MGCLGGAQWIQDYVLKKNPDLNLKVYTIWYSMIKSDTPEAFPTARKILPDKRVSHYWDSKKETGKWFKEVVQELPPKGPIQWDAFYLYGPDAEWPEIKLEAEPGPRITLGRTILQARNKLLEGIDGLKQSGVSSATPAATSPSEQQ
ncbi:MAG: hypothetical protein EXQ56_10175 [Acidobacteria bacterium]|nr:hypothetical protein [Acidobacteriota bacterium]